jgi:hypothetical protein
MARLTMAVACIALLITVGVAGIQSQRQPAGTAHSGNAFRFNKVADGVYHAIGTGTLTVVGNSSVIVNDDDVIVVDDHVSPAAAWVLISEIKTITNKPVRTSSTLTSTTTTRTAIKFSTKMSQSSVTNSRARCFSAVNPCKCLYTRITLRDFRDRSKI